MRSTFSYLKRTKMQDFEHKILSIVAWVGHPSHILSPSQPMLSDPQYFRRSAAPAIELYAHYSILISVHVYNFLPVPRSRKQLAIKHVLSVFPQNINVVQCACATNSERERMLRHRSPSLLKDWVFCRTSSRQFCILAVLSSHFFILTLQCWIVTSY